MYFISINTFFISMLIFFNSSLWASQFGLINLSIISLFLQFLCFGLMMVMIYLDNKKEK